MVEENKMQVCKITLTTTVDGTETQIVKTGYASLSPLRSVVAYQEENAAITLIFEKGNVKLERRGDYELFLLLEQDKLSTGEIGLGGALGKLQAHTHKISYSVGKASLLALLHYDLLFGDERQEMKLRVYVSEIKHI